MPRLVPCPGKFEGSCSTQRRFKCIDVALLACGCTVVTANDSSNLSATTMTTHRYTPAVERRSFLCQVADGLVGEISSGSHKAREGEALEEGTCTSAHEEDGDAAFSCSTLSTQLFANSLVPASGEDTAGKLAPSTSIAE